MNKNLPLSLNSTPSLRMKMTLPLSFEGISLLLAAGPLPNLSDHIFLLESPSAFRSCFRRSDIKTQGRNGLNAVGTRYHQSCQYGYRSKTKHSKRSQQNMFIFPIRFPTKLQVLRMRENSQSKPILPAL